MRAGKHGFRMVRGFLPQTSWAIACILLCSAPLQAAENETYVVQKNDTLNSIARSHRVSVNQLLEANALSRSGHILVGQRLKIPQTTFRESSTRGPSPSGLPSPTQAELNRPRIRPGRWDYIVIHHSATPMGNARSMDRYHREQRHMENGLAYHFVIGNGRGMRDGQIVVGHRWTQQLNGGHLASESLNARSIGICLVGNFEKDRPTGRQLESLDALTEHLMKRCGVSKSRVKTHQQINTVGTRCPGRLFDEGAFLRGLN
jgi:murein DD-endopeptidase MepM/ murein hydrolase activator NlpD